MTFDFTSIIKRQDGSYVVHMNGMPYHVPSGMRGYADLWKQVDAYAKEHPEVVTMEAPYVVPEPTPEELAARALEQAKAERAAAVASITVTVDGMVFDGDEKAQERMARAVLMADSLDEQTEWVLADSTVAVVTAAQLRQACRKAGKDQTVLWIKPYQTEATE